MREASSCTSRSASSRASDPTPAVSPPSSSRSSCQRSRVCCPTPSAASGPGHPAGRRSRLPTERREPLARACRAGQHDEEPRIRSREQPLPAPAGDPLELLPGVFGAQDFGLRRDGPSRLRGLPGLCGRCPDDRAQGGRDRIEAAELEGAPSGSAPSGSPPEERGEARRPEVPTALVKRALHPAEDVALAALALSAERDAKLRRELARALQRLGECARVEEREGARHLGDALPPQEPLLCRLEESRPPRGVLPGAPLDLLAQPHGVGPDIRAREDPSPLPEGRGREAEPHRVRALEGRHDERAAVLKMPRYIVRKPEQNKAFYGLFREITREGTRAESTTALPASAAPPPPAAPA